MTVNVLGSRTVKDQFFQSRILRWLRQNLFSSFFDTALTILAIYILIAVIPPVIEWALINSVWLADSRHACWKEMSSPGEGACWALIIKRLNMFIFINAKTNNYSLIKFVA